MCRYGPVSLDLAVVVSQTTGPRDRPHRRGSKSGTGPLESVSRGLVLDSETVPFGIPSDVIFAHAHIPGRLCISQPY